eukprot:Skav214581  [mRNA]  locus=scaffold57:273821:275296:- [translate_table: standard]
MASATEALRKRHCHGVVDLVDHPIGATTSPHPHGLTLADHTSFGWLLKGQMSVQQRPASEVPNSSGSPSRGIMPSRKATILPAVFDQAVLPEARQSLRPKNLLPTD